MLELGVERLGLGLVDEVAVLAAPGRDRVDDAGGDLTQRALTLDRSELSPEVLLGHDVGGVLRPADGELDPRLFEGHRAVPEVGDAGVAPLPEDLVIGVGVRSGEVTADTDARLLRGHCHWVTLLSSDPRLRSSNHNILWFPVLGAPRCGVHSITVITPM